MALCFISIKRFTAKPYSDILGYPKATKRQINARIKQLEKLKIKSISLSGPVMLGKLAVLGKGYVGVVVLAKKNNKLVALKIRRTDSQRENLKGEARLLKLANKVNVGPVFSDSSKNFLIMEYLDGVRITKWIDLLKGAGMAKKFKTVIKRILTDCYNLDQMNFDHGELSSITKHVIVKNTKPCIIDFESSSTRRRPSNVTSVTQAIFIGSGIAKKAQRIYKNPSKMQIIDSLKQYKQNQNLDNFENILNVLKL